MKRSPSVSARNPLLVALVFAIGTAGLTVPAAGRVWVVAQRQPGANDAGPGDVDHPFVSIAPAAAQAQPGDTVLVHEGIYRERVAPVRGGEAGRPIAYVAAPRETVIVTGADVWSLRWESDPAHPDVRTAKVIFPPGAPNPFRTPYLLRTGYTLGQVSVGGELLTSVPSRDDMEQRPGTWWYDPAADRLHVHFHPEQSRGVDPRVELTVRDRLFAPHRRGLGFIVVRGFIFERAANQFPLRFWTSDSPDRSSPQAGAVGTRSGHDWVIEDNVIRDAAGLGLDCGNEGGRDLEGDQPMPRDIGRHLIRGNRIVDNGASGIMGLGSHGTRIVGNVVERNNRFGNTAPECAGIKLHDFANGIIAGNLIRDNDCAGVWLDNGFTGARVTGNLILGNAEMGIFMELGFGPASVDDNIVGHNGGDGLYAHDASGVTAAHNLFFGNRHYGLYAHVISDRTPSLEPNRRLVETSHWRVLNNIFVDNHGAISLPHAAARGEANLCDFNLFLTMPRDLWENEDFLHFRLNANSGRGPAASANLALSEWQKRSGYDVHSVTRAISDRRPPSYLKGAGPEVAAQLSARGLFLAMNAGAAIAEGSVPRLEGFDEDYFGQPRRDAATLPGPFATVPAGAFRFILWPPVAHRAFRN